ncbi:MAG: SAF domain-containing protein [Knoellia sp.]
MSRPHLPALPRPAILGPSRRAHWRRWVLRRGASSVCAVAAVLMLLALVRPPAPPTTAALVAAKDLRPGVVLTADDLRTTRLPGGPDSPGTVGAVGAPRELVGRRLVSAMQTGELVTTSRLVPRSATEGLPADTVAAHVLHADEGSLDLVSAGQRVTIFADTGGEALARDVLVLGVDTPENATLTGSGANARGLVLALSPEELHRVFAGQRPDGGPPRILTVITR